MKQTRSRSGTRWAKTFIVAGLLLGAVPMGMPQPVTAAACEAPQAFIDAEPDFDPTGESSVVRFYVWPSQPGLTYSFQPDTKSTWRTIRPGMHKFTMRPGEYETHLIVTDPTGCSATAKDRYTAGAVTTYAPTLFFHRDERYFPGSTDDFLSRSQLVHWQPESCGGKKYYAAGEQAREIGGVHQGPLDVDALSNRRGTVYVGTMRDQATVQGHDYCVRFDGMVRSNGDPNALFVRRVLTPPSPRDPIDEGKFRSGFYLNLLNRPEWRTGDLDTAQVYYTYKYRAYVSYWIFYPYNRFERYGVVEIHEGDWEHIVVRLGDDNVPTHTAFYQHNCKPEVLKWADTPRSSRGSTHPAVFPALGGHASYSRDPLRNFGEDADNCTQGSFVWDDRVGMGGRVWAPWMSGQLTLASNERWYGFGGSWGDRSTESTRIANTYGPPAPGPHNPGLPPNWETVRTPPGFQDVTAPTLSAASISQQNMTDQTVNFSITATDDSGAPTHMRVKVSGGEWRSWVPFAATGTVLLPERWGSMSVAFQVVDASGNISDVRTSNAVIRWHATAIGLVQLDNVDNVRSCGAVQEAPCTDVVKRFRISVGGDVLPETLMQVRAWRLVNGTWVESSLPPFRRLTTARSTSFTVTETLLSGLWRFQALVPQDDVRITQFASSDFQYLFVDIDAPTITGTSLDHGDPSSLYASFGLAASDNSGVVTLMRVNVNGNWRDWVPYVAGGTIQLPDAYGPFAIAFQVADGRGNESSVVTAGTVTRIASVSTSLVQVDNNGNVRSCGAESNPCSPVTKKFRIAVSAPITPEADILVKAWRLVNGTWVESALSPYRRLAMASSASFEVTENLLAGKWRFQVQIPVTGTTAFAASGYQFLTIT